MDGFAFIDGLFKSLTTMIGSLAWPAAIFGIVWLFRRKLNELLPLLMLKHKDWEMSFKRELAEVEKELGDLPKPEPTDKRAEKEKQFETLVKISPRGAILDAYFEIEKAVREYARVMGIMKDSDEYVPY